MDNQLQKITASQKVAIIQSMIFIANADRKPSTEDINCIHGIAERVLGISMDDPMFKTFYSKGIEYVISVLGTLDKSTKEWYLVPIHGLIFLNGGKPSEKRFSYTLQIAEDIGFSEDEYFNAVEKAKFLMDKYKF
jgi:hypothetical protein